MATPPTNPAPALSGPVRAADGKRAVAGAGGLTWDDLVKKAQRRIAERIDPVRNKHKPLSILRQEAKRAVEQYFETEFPYVPKDDRAKLTDDVLSDALGLGPLEELFRDESVKEILLLGPSSVIVRKDENWTPASVFFRDREHLRTVVLRTVDQGEPFHPGQTFKSGVDVKLPNGFRVVGIVPPEVMDVMPTVAFVRWASPASGVVATPGPRGAATGSTMQSPTGSSVLSSPVARGGSGVSMTPGPRQVAYATSRSGAGLLGGSPTVTESSAAASSVLATPAPRGESGPNSGIFGNDPYAKMRGKITQRLITKIAAAGIYDLAQIPKAELKRIVTAMVDEANANDKLNLDATESGRLTLEIIAGMQV
jgi:hypothetical protein